MKKLYFEIGMLLVLICCVVAYIIEHPAENTSEIVFNDYVEETSEFADSLTRFVVANYDEIASMEIGLVE